MRSVVQTFSFLLHPFLIPIYFLFLIFHADSVFAWIPLYVI